MATMQASEMKLTEHLLEMRKRVIRIVVVLLVMLAVGLSLASAAISFLKNAPPANSLSWHALSPWDGIRVYMQFSLLFALVVTLPYSLHQLWQFAKPGLTETERRVTLKFIPLSAALMVAGTSFAYLVVFRMSFMFIRRLNASMELEETYGIAQYFSFMFNIVIPCTLMFELPIVIAFLTSLRLCTPSLLRKWRRYSYMLLVVLSTLIAPPDLLSNLFILVPFLLLYEISILLSAAIHKRRSLRDMAWNAEAPHSA